MSAANRVIQQLLMQLQLWDTDNSVYQRHWDVRSRFWWHCWWQLMSAGIWHSVYY